MNPILLTTINARYIHASFGLRYLYANLNEFQDQTTIQEFTKNQDVSDIFSNINSQHPKIIGIGVYIWNALETQALVRLIKKEAPETIVILGGPEVSHFPIRVEFDSADYIIQGEGDLAFYDLIKAIKENKSPRERIIKADIPQISHIKLPYRFYTDDDIKNRVIYVEASRGCPFTCEFCLSSIDKMVRKFDIATLFEEFDKLWNRGARHYKFVDRTFNLDIKTSNQILDYFLSKDEDYFIHFEVIPDHFPESLKKKLELFPKASLQLEIGIQTLNEAVAKRISRNLNLGKIVKNIKYLSGETHAHLHLDLIIGLPGEPLESFGDNLNALASHTNSEIQLGLLKKLSGTCINKHDIEFGMIYSDEPPYEIIQNDLIAFPQMQKLKRFARFWDLYYNSGNFKQSIKLLWPNGEVYQNFYDFSDWVFNEIKLTWKIPLYKLAELLFIYLTEIRVLSKNEISIKIIQDLSVIANRKIPFFLKDHAEGFSKDSSRKGNTKNKRQLKHLQ